MIEWMKRRHWLHTWSKWEIGTYTLTWWNGQKASVHRQRRTCSVCGLHETRGIG